MRIAILAILVLMMASPGIAQVTGRPGGSVPVESTLPANPTDGQIAIRKTDFQLFFYTDSLGVWLGELMTLQPNRRTTGVSGALRWGETNGLIVPVENGMYANADLRLMRVTGSCSDASPACTTFAYADGTKIGAFVWDSDKEDWQPGDAAWVLADSCAWDAGDVMNFQQGAGGSQLADNVITTIFLREQVDP